MAVKAVIFDIGGVVLRSPMLAIAKYEKERGLPPNYINCIMYACRSQPFLDITHYQRAKL